MLCPIVQLTLISRQRQSVALLKILIEIKKKKIIMKPLQDSYRIFAFLCICPSEKPISRWNFYFNILISILSLSLVFIGLIASSAFVSKYLSINLTNALCACYQIAAGISAIYSFITAFIKRDDLKETFDKFQTFYDTCKNI